MKARTDQRTEGRNAKQTDGQTKLKAQQWKEMQTEGRAEAKEESAGLMDGKYKARRISGWRERREILRAALRLNDSLPILLTIFVSIGLFITTLVDFAQPMKLS
uniref:Uncharacterized protein n=1 Tax=Glossina austeni TaxID=7395 RepID=A0A1A9UHK3_GLOAU